MLVENLTSNYYYIASASYALAPEATITIPNEVYLYDDAVARSINTLDEENKATISSAPVGYPRTIGTPEGGAFSGDASDVTVLDSSGYYAGANAEDVLAEIGAALDVPSAFPRFSVLYGVKDWTDFASSFAVENSLTFPPFGRIYGTTNGEAAQFIPVSLRAGTHRVTVNVYKHDAAGIIRLGLRSLSTPTLTTITSAPYSASNSDVDLYSVSPVTDSLVEVCDDLTIPTDGEYTLQCTINGKNASSSAYMISINAIYFELVA